MVLVKLLRPSSLNSLIMEKYKIIHCICPPPHSIIIVLLAFIRLFSNLMDTYLPLAYSLPEHWRPSHSMENRFITEIGKPMWYFHYIVICSEVLYRINWLLTIVIFLSSSEPKCILDVFNCQWHSCKLKVFRSPPCHRPIHIAMTERSSSVGYHTVEH